MGIPLYTVWLSLPAPWLSLSPPSANPRNPDHHGNANPDFFCADDSILSRGRADAGVHVAFTLDG